MSCIDLKSQIHIQKKSVSQHETFFVRKNIFSTFLFLESTCIASTNTALTNYRICTDYRDPVTLKPTRINEEPPSWFLTVRKPNTTFVQHRMKSYQHGARCYILYTSNCPLKPAGLNKTYKFEKKPTMMGHTLIYS